MGLKKLSPEDFLKNLLENGANQHVEANEEKVQLPPWYNERLCKKGQTYFYDNIFGMFVGMLCGLIAVLAIPSILRVLICTNKSSTEMNAYRRYVKTIFHTIYWFRYDLRPGTVAWKSLEAVRNIHSSSSRYSEKSSCGFISQKDMALTQFGFLGFIVNNPKDLGLQGDEESITGFVHYWRVIGYVLGIKEEFNLCAETLTETRERVRLVSDQVYRPALENGSPKFLQMTKVLVSGLWSFNPFLSFGAYLFFTKRLAGCKGYQHLSKQKNPNTEDDNCEFQKLGWYDKYLIISKIYLHKNLLQYWILRIYFNMQIWISEFLIYYLPFLAFHRFGIKKSYVRAI